MEGDVTLRYSEAFKAQVVKEIELKGLSIAEARRRFGIGGVGTIERWVRQKGCNELLRKVVRVETPDEKSRIADLERQKQQLESALAQSQLKVMVLEELIKVAEEEYRIDIKKKSGGKS